MSANLAFECSQQLCEVMEFPRVQHQVNIQLIRTNGGELLTQTVQLKVGHHFHVLLNQSGICIKVRWLLRGKTWKTKEQNAKF